MTNLSTVSPDNQPPSEQDQIAPSQRNGHEQEHLSAQAENSANNVTGSSGVNHAEPSAASPVSALRPAKTRIEPIKGWASLQLLEIWNYRELLFFLTWRDIKVRYKQTIFGASWAIIQPFFTMVVFSLFFGRLAQIPSDGIPYPIFSYAALVPWTFFSNGLTQSSASLGEQFPAHHQSLFPASDYPHRQRHFWRGGLCAGVCGFALDDAFLWH